MNYKELIIASLEVAGIAAVTQFLTIQTVGWETLIPVGFTFVIKFLQELKVRISGTSSKKKVSEYKTLFFKG